MFAHLMPRKSYAAFRHTFRPMNSSNGTPPDPPLPPPSPTPDARAPVGATWEDDETPATLALRAMFALATGAVLLFAQYRSPYFPPAQFWGRWIGTSFVSNFLIPLLIVWMFFGQGLTRPDWLRNERNNAWQYGWKWKNWRRYALFAFAVTTVMAPFLWFASRDLSTRLAYSDYLPPTTNIGQWAVVLASLVFYMFCWEWCFRGFLLFGAAQGIGAAASIIIGAVMFGFAHAGKPPFEFWSSFLGGGALGVICWREKSFVPAFFIHALVQVVWSVMVRI